MSRRSYVCASCASNSSDVTTIGASFDHRVVDGDVASRFLADVASIIEEPALLLE
jgi:pyruvate/2-oxoglutarate dehydrogenase complex dihydrolipoamide acyltransferase (E2) component